MPYSCDICGLGPWNNRGVYISHKRGEKHVKKQKAFIIATTVNTYMLKIQEHEKRYKEDIVSLKNHLMSQKKSNDELKQEYDTQLKNLNEYIHSCESKIKDWGSHCACLNQIHQEATNRQTQEHVCKLKKVQDLSMVTINTYKLQCQDHIHKLKKFHELSSKSIEAYKLQGQEMENLRKKYTYSEQECVRAFARISVLENEKRTGGIQKNNQKLRTLNIYNRLMNFTSKQEKIFNRLQKCIQSEITKINT
jgi:hypothetical protein